MAAQQPCDNMQSITRSLESIMTQSNYLYRSLNIIKQVCFVFALTRTQSRKVELPLNPKPIVFFKSKLPLKPMGILITLANLAKIIAQSRFPCLIQIFKFKPPHSVNPQKLNSGSYQIPVLYSHSVNPQN